MNEKPILFQGDMVRAILEGRKTETRRIIKPRPVGGWAAPGKTMYPYGQIGDRLWVRETICIYPDGNENPVCVYRATDEKPDTEKWTPSIFMPRQASRITLEITEIKVERVQDIGQMDVVNEGMTMLTKDNGITYKFGMADFDGLPGNDDCGWHWKDWKVDHKQAFANLWDSINKKRGFGWDSNPWVWVVKFRRLI